MNHQILVWLTHQEERPFTCIIYTSFMTKEIRSFGFGGWLIQLEMPLLPIGAHLFSASTKGKYFGQ